jgi:hypothetical protein
MAEIEGVLDEERTARMAMSMQRWLFRVLCMLMGERGDWKRLGIAVGVFVLQQWWVCFLVLFWYWAR